MSEHSGVKSGSLLVASPELRGPDFGRTVVYMITHGEEGSLGVVLNKPSEIPVQNVLPQWTELAAKSKVVFVGGPMELSSAMCVGVCRPGVDASDIEGLAPIAGPVCLVSVDSAAGPKGLYLKGVRIFGGHAGWAPGQLVDEVAEGAWSVVASSPQDVLAGPKVDVWFEVLRRQRFPLRWQAWHPGDLERN
ncbi:DUF179 domain-containing protein [Nakamurella antarctica]|uniref:UPF0301 protein EH165_15105 n=1 Tax=Nakamurella antarctica TaxID=1902245 RepID=A0A3G8ZPV5_9ACTN|nr:YqgE/AlgH family protein [Nakamurella antarctica]AZI59269.1 DUF179 domain-containing protein [Nakamurella antarctica]